MINTENVKDTLQQELEELHRARELLLLESTLKHTDVHREWDRVDEVFQFAQQEINRLGDHSVEAAEEIEAAARTLLNQIKQEFELLRRPL